MPSPKSTNAEKKSKSPYARYGKAPYQYRFRGCSHRGDSGALTTVFQTTPDWRGDVCTKCNIIVNRMERRRS